MLHDYHGDLHVAALPQELEAARARTEEFLRTQAARVTLEKLGMGDGRLSVAVRVENLTGHKLPTAYPSRRAWLHVVVTDASGRKVFESGALRADGSIEGNVNDEDPHRYEPHFTEITRPEQVEIFEPILKDAQGQVTTGLLSAVGYLKDNRLLPAGFDKRTAEPDIAVVGKALDDPDFTGGGSVIRYVVDTHGTAGPFHVKAELWYEPVGYRWAHNLAPYEAAEPQRFVHYYEAESGRSAMVLASVELAVSH
jgi:ABC-type cobalt transport system substrate-binding protein